MNIVLKQPYWSAWKKWESKGWPEGVEGFGVDLRIVWSAAEKKQPIVVHVMKSKFRIDPQDFMKEYRKYESTFKAKGNTVLAVIPRTAFEEVLDG